MNKLNQKMHYKEILRAFAAGGIIIEMYGGGKPMSEAYDNLLKAFDVAIKKKENNKFTKEDVKNIYTAAHKLFDGSIELNQRQLETVRDKWVHLAEGRIDKGSALRKLQGTSRAEAVQSVLLSLF